MPWTAKTFKQKHNHKLSPAKAKKAASIATAILRSGGSDGVAIATANKFVKKKSRTKRKKS